MAFLAVKKQKYLRGAVITTGNLDPPNLLAYLRIWQVASIITLISFVNIH